MLYVIYNTKIKIPEGKRGNKKEAATGN